MVYVIGIVAALIILFGFLCYKKAPPTEAIVVTGFGLSKPKVVCGKGTFVLPVLQRADRLNMRLLKIDVKTPETGVKTKNGVSLWIDSVVTIQVYSENSTVLDEEVKASGLKDAKFLLQYMPAADARAYMRGINTKDILRYPFAIRENNCTVGEISVIHTKTGFLQGYNSIAMQLYGEEYQSYKIGFGKEGVCCPVFLGGQQIAQINKSAVVKDNLDEYLIYAVNEMALLPSVMFAIYIDGIYYANRGVYVDDATTINCEYSLNEEVLSHYDPNFVKGL